VPGAEPADGRVTTGKASPALAANDGPVGTTQGRAWR
jgi:hypothetical protein